MKGTSQDSLIKAIRSRITDAGLQPGDPLPSARSLAREFGVSHPTLGKAIQGLIDVGLVIRSPGSYRVRLAGYGKSVTAPVMPRIEALSSAILEMRLTGAIGRSGWMPPRRALCSSLQCSPSLLAKAIQRLISSGAVRSEGRRYRFTSSPGKRKPGSRVFICSRTSIFRIPSETLRNCVKGIETELDRQGWHPPDFVFDTRPGRMESPPEIDIAGFILLGLDEAWWSFLRRYRHVPLVVLDLHASEYWRRGSPVPHIRILRMDQVRAGCAIGELLRAGGHRRVAYFSDLLPEPSWSRLRREGLETVFPGDIGTSKHFRPSPEHVKASLALPLDELFVPQLGGKLRQSPYWNPRWTEYHLGGLYTMHHWLRWSPRMWPVFEAAYSEHDITAWVCCNDELAMMAATFLEKQGDRTRRVALAGFDNIPMAYAAGLTTYDFNAEVMGESAVRCLASPAKGFKGAAPLNHIGRPVMRASAP